MIFKHPADLTVFLTKRTGCSIHVHNTGTSYTILSAKYSKFKKRDVFHHWETIRTINSLVFTEKEMEILIQDIILGDLFGGQ